MRVTGILLARDHGGGTALPLDVLAGLPGGCRGTVRLYPPRSADALAGGAVLEIEGVWRRSRVRRPSRPETAGYLSAHAVETAPAWARGPSGLVWFRGRIQDRVAELFPLRAGMVDALVLARREGLDPDLRDAFARSGTAHLLAISGFHVGVVAALVLGGLRAAGCQRRRAVVFATVATLAYVVAIGLPHAATRAGAILLFLALARLRGRPVHSLGALATAMLFVLVVDPGAITSAGFQLSFAGAAGLVLLYRRLLDALRRAAPVRMPRYLAEGIASGAAATIPTLPLVAWHFDRVSLIGIPVTVVVTPLISVAIPGIFASLLVSLPVPAAGRFLAGGVETILLGAEALVAAASALPGVAPWVPRWWFAAAALGAAVPVSLLRLDGRLRRSLGGGVRAFLLAAGAAAAVLLWPPVSAGRGGTVELHFLDVGQGDAAAIRSPRGRWILVDTGPRSPTFDAGERRVAPFLLRRGVRRLEAVVLTHPHLDHFGGSVAVLEAVRVRGFLDPAWPTASAPYLGLLETARATGRSWWPAREGLSFELDGVFFEVLHPRPADLEPGATDDPNDVSVVLAVRFGAFTALLTGDAPAEVERRIATELGPFDVLKAGHHGSRTSTAGDLLVEGAPELAVLSLGARNRFGHPHDEVVRRLDQRGVRWLRTDERGTVTVRARTNGTFSVEEERRSAAPLLFRGSGLFPYLEIPQPFSADAQE